MNKRIAYLVVIISPFILFLPEIVTGKSIFWGLPILQFYPWRELAFNQLLNGQLPLWNPYNGLGTPLLANYQSALLYPFTWVILFFYLIGNLQGLVWGHLFINILHLSIAGIGILKICEEKQYSLQGAVISAISFSLSGYFLARFGFFSMIWSAAWFPWIFYYTEKVFISGKFSIATIKLTIFISLLLLSGHAQLSWYILLFSGFYLLFKISKPVKAWLKAFSQFIIASVIAIGVTAIQLLPTAELLLNSQRSAEVDTITSMTYSFWPWHFLNLLNPHIFGHPITGDYWGYGAFWEDAIYIGLLPLLLGLFIIILMIRKRELNAWKSSEIIYLGIMTFISIVLSLGSNTAVFPWLYNHIPTFDMFNAPARYMIWFVFSLSILAGAAFDLWRKPEKKTLYWVRLGTAGGFAIGLGALIMLLTGDAIKPTFIKATFEISILFVLIGILYLFNPIDGTDNCKNRKVDLWKWVVVCFVLLDLFYMNLNHTPGQKISTIDNFIIKANNNDIKYLPEKDDYEFRYNVTLNFDDYNKTISNTNLAASNLANVNIFNRIVSLNNFEPMRIEAYDGFISQLNELSSEEQKEILSRYGITRIGYLDQTNSPVVNYDKIDAANRIRFFTNRINTDSMQSMLSELGTMDCVYLIAQSSEGQQNIISGCQPVSGKVTNAIWKDNKISFDLNIQNDAWVLISDTYDSGWKLYIDGYEEKLYQANGFIKAFEVSSGEHSIVLSYLPDSFIIGSLISLASLIMMCILVYRLRKTQHSGVIVHGD